MTITHDAMLKAATEIVTRTVHHQFNVSSVSTAPQYDDKELFDLAVRFLKQEISKRLTTQQPAAGEET